MVKFSFWAYGILAIAALALVLYVYASEIGQAQVSENLWYLVVLIVVAFIVYMFVKLLRWERRRWKTTPRRAPSSSVTKLAKKAHEVKSRIDSARELYELDLSKAKAKLADIETAILTDIVDDKPIDHYYDKLCEPEFEAYDGILNRLVSEISEYADELEEYLIDTSELRIAIEKAKRQRAKAKVYFFNEKKLDEGISLLEKEAEKLYSAKSEWKAKESSLRRKTTSTLVNRWLILLGILLPVYVTTMIFYFETNPLETSSLILFIFLYFMGCLAIYTIMGKFGLREEEEKEKWPKTDISVKMWKQPKKS